MAIYFVNQTEMTLNFGDISIPIGYCIKGSRDLSKQAIALLKHASLRKDVKEYAEIPPGVKLAKGFVEVEYNPPEIEQIAALTYDFEEPVLELENDKDVIDFEDEPATKKKTSTKKSSGGSKKKKKASTTG